VLELVNEYAETLRFTPRLTFAGPIDLLADDALTDDAVAVIREGLSNVLQHAQARSVDLHLDGTGDSLVVVIRDDGTGIDAPARSSGLTNLETRARSRGGSFSARRLSPHGTELRWAVPARLDDDGTAAATERAAR
jgi:signal transduction histidine kinase